MLRFGLPGILGILMLVFWVWCIFDVVATDNSLCRNLPKSGWLLLVIILPDIGGIAWVVLGRPERAGLRPGDTGYGRAGQVRGPDDDPAFSRSMYPPAPRSSSSPGSSGASEADQRRAQLEAWEDDLARREAELKAADLARREAELRRRAEGSADSSTDG